MSLVPDIPRIGDTERSNQAEPPSLRERFVANQCPEPRLPGGSEDCGAYMNNCSSAVLMRSPDWILGFQHNLVQNIVLNQLGGIAKRQVLPNQSTEMNERHVPGAQ